MPEYYISVTFASTSIEWSSDIDNARTLYHSVLADHISSHLHSQMIKCLAVKVTVVQGVLLTSGLETQVSKPVYSSKYHDLCITINVGRGHYRLQSNEFKKVMVQLFTQAGVKLAERMTRLVEPECLRLFRKAMQDGLREAADECELDTVEGLTSRLPNRKLKPNVNGDSEETRYHIYFRNKKSALSAASELSSNLRYVLDLDDTGQVALEVWEIGNDGIDIETERMMERLAAQHGGEYDGFDTRA